jgi:hypothetical protein
MNVLRRSALIAPIALLLSITLAHAIDHVPNAHGQTTRTYFGRPGTGPYQTGPTGAGALCGQGGCNPYTCKVFGFRFCKTPESVQEDYLRRLAAAEARAQVIVSRVQPQHLCGNVLPGGGGCNCPAGECFLFGHCQKHGQGGAGCGPGGCGGHFGYNNALGAALPGMNREDATRYMEGYQYYPPYHLLRSPRDHYMFDVKYGLGR